MPLTSLHLGRYYPDITDGGLAELRAAPLKDLYLVCCDRVTDDGVRSLIEGKSLTRISLSACRRLSSGILPTLIDLPLEKLLVSGFGADGGLSSSDAAMDGLFQAIPSLQELTVNDMEEISMVRFLKRGSTVVDYNMWTGAPIFRRFWSIVWESPPGLSMLLWV